MKVFLTLFILFASAHILKHYFPDMEIRFKIILSIAGALIAVIVLLATSFLEAKSRRK